MGQTSLTSQGFTLPEELIRGGVEESWGSGGEEGGVTGTDM